MVQQSSTDYVHESVRKVFADAEEAAEDTTAIKESDESAAKNIACVKLGILVWFMYSRLVPDTCFAPYLTNLTKNCREQHRPISREVSLRSQRKGHTRIDSSIFVHVQLFN